MTLSFGGDVERGCWLAALTILIVPTYALLYAAERETEEEQERETVNQKNKMLISDSFAAVQ